jgi:GT2 family glycosyltransferase
MVRRARDPGGSRETGSVAAVRSKVSSFLRSQWRWHTRPRFPPPLPEAEAWREIEGTQLSLPTSEQPEVSVIIPVYGQLAATWSCLRSLAGVPAGKSIEVIVANDCSPDRTSEMLSRVRGVRTVENPENLGFLRTCNRAAREARGRYLCLLNNDTLLTPDWLSPMVESFELFPRAGLVGAKLLFGDGRLQEAGGTAFRDGTTSHYGRRKDPARPEYSFARRVDYCSAACALIPKSLWDELGGFDEYYAPAYYEDTDLAFRVRRAGYEVIYQPATTIVHFEGLTHGKVKSKMQAKTPSKNLIANRQKFFERWSELLLSEHAPPETRTWSAADRRRGPGLLVLSEVPLTPNGGAAAAALAADAAGFQVTLWSPAHDPSPARDSLQRRGIQVLYPPYSRPVADFLRSSEVARFGALLVWDHEDAPQLLSTARRTAGHLKLFAFLSRRTARVQPAPDEAADPLRCFDAVLTDDESLRAALTVRLPHTRLFATTDAELWQVLARVVRTQR